MAPFRSQELARPSHLLCPGVIIMLGRAKTTILWETGHTQIHQQHKIRSTAGTMSHTTYCCRQGLSVQLRRKGNSQGQWNNSPEKPNTGSECERTEELEKSEMAVFAHAPVLVFGEWAWELWQRASQSFHNAPVFRVLCGEAFCFVATGMYLTEFWPDSEIWSEVLVQTAAWL